MASRDSRDGSAREQVAAVVALTRELDLSVTAAGVAYYAFNALLPTLVVGVLALSAGGYVGGAAERVAAVADVPTGDVMPVAEAIRDSEGIGRLAVLAVGIATWSALALGRAVAQVFGDVYGEVHETRLERVRDVVVVFLTWVAALVLVLLLGVLLAVLEPALVTTIGLPVALFAAFVAVFLPMFLVFPDSVSLREALPGTAFAAAVWTLSALAFRVYAGSSTSVQLFGAIGVILLVLTWLYVGSLALLVGAAVNAVFAGQAGRPRT